MVAVATDDEFMMLDWTKMWYDERPSDQTHLLIVPNTEHTLGTNLYGTLSAVCTFFKSIAAGKKERPNFSYSVNPKDGEVSVVIPEQYRD